MHSRRWQPQLREEPGIGRADLAPDDRIGTITTNAGGPTTPAGKDDEPAVPSPTHGKSGAGEADPVEGGPPSRRWPLQEKGQRAVRSASEDAEDGRGGAGSRRPPPASTTAGHRRRPRRSQDEPPHPSEDASPPPSPRLPDFRPAPQAAARGWESDGLSCGRRGGGSARVARGGDAGASSRTDAVFKS